MNFQSAITIFLLMLSCLVSHSAWSDVEIDYKTSAKTLMVVFLTKSITEDDYSKIDKQANMIKKMLGQAPVILIKLNSTGGNISAALKIGRLLRKYGAMANVDENAICLSSCVYVLAGAPNRAVDGTVAIHRPYDPNDKATSEVAQSEKYKKLGIQIAAYLKEMNIPTSLYDNSLFISPDRVKTLSFNEMQAYGLNENDPYADEAGAVQKAQKLGISRKEYVLRKARAHKECGLNSVTNDMPDHEVISRWECQDAVLDGSR